VRLQPLPIEVTSILNEAIEVVRPAAEAKDISLHLDAHTETGLVMADPARLQQVFWNLLSNAVKFTDRGGKVTTSLQPLENQVHVSVSDTGIGIPADFLPFVFEPFRQANGTAARSQGGLGLVSMRERTELVRTHTRRVLRRRAGGSRAGAENASDVDDAADESADATEQAESTAGESAAGREPSRPSESSRPVPSKPAPGARPVRPTGTRRPTGKRNVGRR